MKWSRLPSGEYELRVHVAADGYDRRRLVWKFGPRQWRHNRMGIMQPHFRTLREAKADAER